MTHHGDPQMRNAVGPSRGVSSPQNLWKVDRRWGGRMGMRVTRRDLMRREEDGDAEEDMEDDGEENDDIDDDEEEAMRMRRSDGEMRRAPAHVRYSAEIAELHDRILHHGMLEEHTLLDGLAYTVNLSCRTYSHDNRNPFTYSIASNYVHVHLITLDVRVWLWRHAVR
eukprot:9497835-Pyramimonas_sp.AAC.1